MSCELYLARHGQTAWNAAHRVQGSIDIDLDERGKAQAQALGAVMTSIHAQTPLTRLVCSDMLRTRSTIAPFRVALEAKGRPLACNFTPWWRERGHGILEGLTQQEIESRHPELEKLWKKRAPGNWLPEGESLDGVAQRVAFAMKAFEADFAALGAQRLFVVTHGGTLDAVHRYAKAMPLNAPRNFTLGNCELSKLVFDGAAWHIEFWGDKTHLAGL